MGVVKRYVSVRERAVRGGTSDAQPMGDDLTDRVKVSL